MFNKLHCKYLTIKPLLCSGLVPPFNREKLLSHFFYFKYTWTNKGKVSVKVLIITLVTCNMTSTDKPKADSEVILLPLFPSVLCFIGILNHLKLHWN